MKIKKIQLLLLVPLSTVIIFTTGSRSHASILDSIKGIWENASNIVVGTFDRFVGDYVSNLANFYAPIGIDKIAGALGLPDTGEISQKLQARSEQNETENNDIAAGDLDTRQLAASTSKSLGEAVFSQEGQNAANELSNSVTGITKSTAEVAEECQNVDVTQQVLHCLTIQNANAAQTQQAILSLMQQNNQLNAAVAIAEGQSLEQQTEEAKAAQRQIDQQGHLILDQVQVNNAVLDGLADQSNQ